jgi:hypothetical protein
MNRRKRSRTAALTNERTVSLGSISISGSTICVWLGCRASYTGDLPLGWAYLLTNGGFGRDYAAMLCPEHNVALGKLLKPRLADLPDPSLPGEPQGRRS